MADKSDASGAPWDADLTTAFPDEDVRQQVSDFMGKSVQPYVTKLEQDSRPNRDASRLWEGFSENPVETSIGVVQELYGDAIAEKFAELIEKGSSPSEAAEQVGDETQVDVSKQAKDAEKPAEPTEAEKKLALDDLPVEVREAIAAQQAEKQREAYYEEFDRVVDEHKDDLPKDDEGNATLDVELFHPFVVSTNGDFDAAYEAYTKWQGKAKEAFGTKEDGTAATPPPTIDSTTRNASQTPPQQKDYKGDLDAALDDFFQEKNTPPPTVGAV